VNTDGDRNHGSFGMIEFFPGSGAYGKAVQKGETYDAGHWDNHI
jgi:hypothetical protein